jgi:hypothetical protein
LPVWPRLHWRIRVLRWSSVFSADHQGLLSAIWLLT